MQGRGRRFVRAASCGLTRSAGDPGRRPEDAWSNKVCYTSEKAQTIHAVPGPIAFRASGVYTCVPPSHPPREVVMKGIAGLVMIPLVWIGIEAGRQTPADPIQVEIIEWNVP